MILILLYLFVGLIFVLVVNYFNKEEPLESKLNLPEQIALVFLWPAMLLISLVVISRQIGEAVEHLKEIKEELKNNEVISGTEEEPKFTRKDIK